MSRDRGTQKQKHDFGYGQVCTQDGTPIAGYIMDSANQENGIVCRADRIEHGVAELFPVGTPPAHPPESRLRYGDPVPRVPRGPPRGEV